MNLKIFTVGLLSAFFSISCLYAAGSSAAQSKTDMKAEFKRRVTKNDFGDIFISINDISFSDKSVFTMLTEKSLFMKDQ